MKKSLIYIFLIGFMFFGRSVSAQDGRGDMIVGKVVAADTREELIAASVTEIDKTGRVVAHAITDLNGDFSMKIENPQNRLQVSYLGFKTVTLAIGSNRSFTIVMQEDNMLEEVVITRRRMASDGLMSIPEREVSFAMQKINTKEFEGVQVSSIDDALQGHIAGLDIIGSGEIGKGTQMRIRGVSSLNANSEPLIVINGVPREDISSESFDFASANMDQFGDLLNVNPDDIEEIQVLKDAAATAIWGSKGANGILMITTKKGAKGPTRVTYNYKFSGEYQPAGMKMLNGDDYTMLMKQAYFNPRQDNSATDNVPELNYVQSWSEYENFNNNTDWRKEVIQPGSTHDHYLSVSGGGERANFRVGVGYMTRKGTVIGQTWDRFTTRSDLDYYVSSRIRVSSEFNFSYSDNDRNWTDGRTEYEYNNWKSILDLAYRKMPNVSVYTQDANGNNLDSYYNILQSSNLHESQKVLRNPVALARLGVNNLKSYMIQPLLRLRYDLIEPTDKMLQYEGYVSFTIKNEKTHKFLPKEVTTRTWTHEDINRSEDFDQESFKVQTYNKITWVPLSEDSDHYLQFLAAVDTEVGNSDGQTMISYGMPSSSITDASSGGYLYQLKGGLVQNRYMGVVARAHYSYKSKYVISGVFRREGSTKFGKDNKWGNFPAISLRWNIIDEPFMESTKGWLDMLAIRPGWGMTGNQPGDDYLHFSRYKAEGTYAGYPTIKPENIRLSNLKWESKSEYNIGLDVAVLDFKYTLDANLYHSRTKDLLFKDKAIPTTTGYGSLTYRNVGTMDNDGWELNFNANRFLTIGNVSFDARFNIAHSVNTLVSLDEDVLSSVNETFENKNGQYLVRMQEGKSYGSIYGFRYKGVYTHSIDTYMNNEAIRNNPDYSAPVARKSNGDIVYYTTADGRQQALPMYFNYGVNGINYPFQAGDAIYEDINNDGNIDEQDIVYLGNCNPKFSGGFGLTLRWNRFTCNMHTTFRYGNKIINDARMNAENMYTNNNQSVAVNWRWRKEGDVTDMPRALYNYGYNWLASDRFVEDGSHFRMKYITLMYNASSEVAKKIGARQLQFSLTVNNLFTLTNYWGVDPEVGYNNWGIAKDESTTPRSRDFTLGVTVGF